MKLKPHDLMSGAVISFSLFLAAGIISGCAESTDQYKNSDSWDTSVRPIPVAAPNMKDCTYQVVVVPHNGKIKPDGTYFTQTLYVIKCPDSKVMTNWSSGGKNPHKVGVAE